MKGVIRNLNLIVALFLALALTSGAAYGVPSLPHSFYGNASIGTGSASAPAGTTIIAKINGVEKGKITTQEKGSYGGSGGFDPKLSVANASDGDNITFYVNGLKNKGGPAVFTSGKVSQLDLAWPELPKQTNVSKSPDDKVVDKGVVVEPGKKVNYKFGNEAEVDISSKTSTAANIKNISKMDNSTSKKGTTGLSSGKKELNTYEVNIEGNVSINVTMSYDDQGIDESTIDPHKFNGSSWEEIPDSDVLNLDTSNNEVTFKVKSAQTPYGVFASSSSGGGSDSTDTTTAGGGGGGGAAEALIPEGPETEDTETTGDETPTQEELGADETEETDEEAPGTTDDVQTGQEGEETQQGQQEQGTEEETQQAGAGITGAFTGTVGEIVSSMYFWIFVGVMAAIFGLYLLYRTGKEEEF